MSDQPNEIGPSCPDCDDTGYLLRGVGPCDHRAKNRRPSITAQVVQASIENARYRR